MQSGWSFNPTGMGKDHYPIENVLGWDDTYTRFTIALDLEPNKEYGREILGNNFTTREGSRIKPEIFRFKTKNMERTQ